MTTCILLSWEWEVSHCSFILDSNLKLTAKVDLCFLFPLDHEVIQLLECFLPLKSSILIAWNHEDNNRVEEYLGKRKYLLSIFHHLGVLKPYFWSYPAFDVVDFDYYFFSFSRNFPSNYHMLFRSVSHPTVNFTRCPSYEMLHGGEAVKGEML